VCRKPGPPRDIKTHLSATGLGRERFPGTKRNAFGQHEWMIFRGQEPSAALSGGAVRGKAKWLGSSRVKIQSLIGRPARMARLRMGWTDRHTATDELGAKVSGTSARRVGKRLSRCLRATREPLNNPTGNAKPSTLFEARVSGAAEPSGCAAAIQGACIPSGMLATRVCWIKNRPSGAFRKSSNRDGVRLRRLFGERENGRRTGDRTTFGETGPAGWDGG
jgi:hypothetical protein